MLWRVFSMKWLRYVLPRSAVMNGGYCCRRDAIIARHNNNQLTMREAFANYWNIRRAQLAHAVTFATSHTLRLGARAMTISPSKALPVLCGPAFRAALYPALRNGVQHVLPRSSDKVMRRVTAGAVVARMTDELPSSKYASFGDALDDSVRQHSGTSKAATSVSVGEHGVGPRPAGIGATTAINVLVEEGEKIGVGDKLGTHRKLLTCGATPEGGSTPLRHFVHFPNYTVTTPDSAPKQPHASRVRQFGMPSISGVF